MRHQVAGRKLGRKSAHRTAMFRNMVSSLVQHGRIKTTLHKAKELRRIADQLVTLGKKDSLHARRQVFDWVRNRKTVQTLFSKIAPAFSERKGGYTRIYHAGHRVGDGAKMAVIEYLNEDRLAYEVSGGSTSKKTATKKKKASTVKKATKADKK